MTTKPLNILILCNKSPYPPKEGGPLAMYNIIKGLLAFEHNVKVLTISTKKFMVDTHKIPVSFREQTHFESVFIDTTPSVMGALKNLFGRKSYHIERFYHIAFAEKLKQLIKTKDYDIIQLESLYMMPYVNTLRSLSKARIVLRSHNIEHVIWERIVRGEKNILKKIYLIIQAQRLKKYELKHLNTCDGIAAITDVDAAFFKANGCRKPVTTIPFGIDISAYDPISDAERQYGQVFFLGSLNWIPNMEGLDWFLNKVWDGITDADKQAQLNIAGRHTPERLMKLKKRNVKLLGEVPDALSFMQSQSIMIVPLFSGSGMRIKIIEGMYAGNTIISTSIGAEGIDYTDGHNIVIADTTADFKKAVLKYLNRKDLCDKIGNNARQLVLEKYRNTSIMKRLLNFYELIK